jgi:hypothetical protein
MPPSPPAEKAKMPALQPPRGGTRVAANNEWPNYHIAIKSLAFRMVPIDRRNFGLNSEGGVYLDRLGGCEMRGNLAEPNLTRRLALLAEARRDDSSVCQHLIEAKAEIERLQAALVGIAKAPREPPAAHFMRDIANAALRPELRDATG